jgi:hypothetical protein
MGYDVTRTKWITSQRYALRFALTALACCSGCAADDAPQSLEGSAGRAALAQTAELDLGLDEESQLSLEEDYAYPDAERHRDAGIDLKKGDGHLLLVDCASADSTVTVESFDPPADFCFQIRGTRAFVSMELTNVYLIRSAQRGLTATVLLANGQRDSVALQQGLNPIAGGAGATLLELSLAPP